MFESENVQSLSDKIIAIFNKEDQIDTVRENGKNLIKLEYNWDKIGSLLKDIYSSL